jgi:hypothetical protein
MLVALIFVIILLILAIVWLNAIVNNQAVAIDRNNKKLEDIRLEISDTNRLLFEISEKMRKMLP